VQHSTTTIIMAITAACEVPPSQPASAAVNVHAVPSIRDGSI